MILLWKSACKLTLFLIRLILRKSCHVNLVVNLIIIRNIWNDIRSHYMKPWQANMINVDDKCSIQRHVGRLFTSFSDRARWVLCAHPLPIHCDCAAAYRALLLTFLLETYLNVCWSILYAIPWSAKQMEILFYGNWYQDGSVAVTCYPFCSYICYLVFNRTTNANYQCIYILAQNIDRNIHISLHFLHNFIVIFFALHIALIEKTTLTACT